MACSKKNFGRDYHCTRRAPPLEVRAATGAPLRRNLAHRAIRQEVDGRGGLKSVSLGVVLDLSLGTVAASGGLGVPFAVRRLVFDHLGPAGNALLGRGAAGSGHRIHTVRETLRKRAVDGVGPTAIMLDDLVADVAHRELPL